MHDSQNNPLTMGTKSKLDSSKWPSCQRRWCASLPPMTAARQVIGQQVVSSNLSGHTNGGRNENIRIGVEEKRRCAQGSTSVRRLFRPNFPAYWAAGSKNAEPNSPNPVLGKLQHVVSLAASTTKFGMDRVTGRGVEPTNGHANMRRV